MDYLALKLVHQCAVGASVAGFAVRGLASFAGCAWVRGRIARTLPHLIDTVLLASGVTLAWWLRLPPTKAPWLAAKLLGLTLYVVLGIVALRPNRPLGIRVVAWLAALATVTWMVSVAITKDPRGILASLVG